jgi:hypothetical protein
MINDPGRSSGLFPVQHLPIVDFIRQWYVDRTAAALMAHEKTYSYGDSAGLNAFLAVTPDFPFNDSEKIGINQNRRQK